MSTNESDLEKVTKKVENTTIKDSEPELEIENKTAPETEGSPDAKIVPEKDTPPELPPKGK